ncbi:hypothetical protein RHGRI_033131 [Rhododendron griersonianum]|uniref:Uncharacterized protein n=1 Tax=Rhododendron griersonianum TaxID=479676 RepID=A0AAV6I183_9ERIC|nr:hypothetical protein RHGRI_033131 [Rhododendron griersonianum]
MAAGSPSSSIVPDSDPREYHPPPPHKFEPVGLKLYKPKRNTFDSGLVLREEVPQLPEQVIYFSRRGQWRSDDIPSPDHVELALPPSVQQVYFLHSISKFSLHLPFVCYGILLSSAFLRLKNQRVASAGYSASAPQGERASTMGRGSGDDDRDEEDNEEEDDEEDNVGSEDEEEGEEESEEEDRELASREASPLGPSSKKPRRGHLKLAHQLCDELGVLASSVTGVDVELKTEASLRHARTLLAAKQFSQASAVAHSLFCMCHKLNKQVENAMILLLLAEIHKVHCLNGATKSSSDRRSVLAAVYKKIFGKDREEQSCDFLACVWVFFARCLRKLWSFDQLVPYSLLSSQQDAFYLMAIVFDALGQLEHREEAATSFRKHMIALENPQDCEKYSLNTAAILGTNFLLESTSYCGTSYSSPI